MNKFRIITLLSGFLLYFPLQAQKTADVIKKTIKATTAFKDYDIKFEKRFKYPLEKDTVDEVYHSLVYRTDMEYNIGWHRIYYKDGMQPRSLVASNTKLVARLNFKENLYFQMSLADDEKKVISAIKSNLYHPFMRSKEDYGKFVVLKSDKRNIWLQEIDTLKDANRKVKLINTTILTINAETFIPEMEESWTEFRNGSVQYGKYSLLEYHHLPAKNYESVLKTSDSLIRYITSFDNGDSVKESRKKAYKQVKIGDTAYSFKGTEHDGKKSFDLASVKDSIIIIDFFYTSCKPCAAAVQEIDKVFMRNKDKGVTVIGVDAFSSDWVNLDKFISEKGIHYPIVETKNELVLEYGVTGYPRMFIIKNGLVVKIFYGFTKDLDRLLQNQVDALLK
jgi:peroxiredoxin